MNMPLDLIGAAAVLYYESLKTQEEEQVEENNKVTKEELFPEEKTLSEEELKALVRGPSQTGNLQTDIIKYKLEKQLSQIFHAHPDLHKAIRESSFFNELRENPNQGEYLKYLIFNYKQLKIIEDRIASTNFPGKENIDFSSLFRKANLKKDILALKEQLKDKKIEIDKKALKEHLDYLQNAEFITLFSHAFTIYFGTLHGGQRIAESLKKFWGDQAPCEYYSFNSSPQDILALLTPQLNAFGMFLASGDYILIKEEIKKQYLITGKMIGLDLTNWK